MRILTLTMLLASTALASPVEQARLVAHFDSVLAELLAADTGHLTPAASAERQRMISILAAYRDAGRFPQNPSFLRPTPFFVDHRGTRCAMAHLIEASGNADYVEAVAASRNTAFVDELADDPALHRWLKTHGLTVAEAARIQPSYCYEPAHCHCIMVDFLGRADDALYVGTRIEGERGRVRIEGTVVGEAAAGFEPGEELDATLPPSVAVGATVWGMRRLNGEVFDFAATHRIEGEQAHCLPDSWFALDGSVPTPAAVPVDVMAEAAASPECHAELIAHNPELARNCDDELLPGDATLPDGALADGSLDMAPEREIGAEKEEGCQQAPGPGWMLLAMLLAARRRFIPG